MVDSSDNRGHNKGDLRRKAKPYDHFGKALLAAAMADAGHVESELDVRSVGRRVDLVFTPHTTKRKTRKLLGALTPIASSPSLIELFHDPPSIEKILACMHKQLSEYFQRQKKLTLKQKPTRQRTASDPLKRLRAMWVISGGVPKEAMAQFGAVQSERLPQGFYRLGAGLKFNLIVVSELEVNRGTVLLRLLGNVATIKAAIAELNALPSHCWECEVALPWLNHLHSSGAVDVLTSNKIEREQLMKSLANTIVRLSDMRQQWLEEGRQEVLLGLAERRLERALTSVERSRMQRRIEKRGAEALEIAVLNPDVTVLKKWISAPKSAVKSKAVGRRSA